MKINIRKKLYHLLLLGSTLILSSCSEEPIMEDKSIIIESETEINDPFYKTIEKENERQKDIERIKKEQISFYNENKKELKNDSNKDEILIEDYDDMNAYSDLIAVRMSDKYNLELYDYVCVSGVGNTLETGEGREINDYSYNSTFGVIINIDNDKSYPYAVAKVDEETNELTSFIGWYKKESLLNREEVYGLVIERPLAKKVIKVTEDNFVYYSKDGTILCIPENGFFPEDYTAIDKNHEYGIDIDYTSKVPNRYIQNDYLTNTSNRSVFIVPENMYKYYDNNNGIIKKKLKYKCNHELVKEKYFK